jgi:hypothetical protein
MSDLEHRSVMLDSRDIEEETDVLVDELDEDRERDLDDMDDELKEPFRACFCSGSLIRAVGWFCFTFDAGEEA